MYIYIYIHTCIYIYIYIIKTTGTRAYLICRRPGTCDSVERTNGEMQQITNKKHVNSKNT